MLVTLVAQIGVLGYVAQASGDADGEAAPIFGIKFLPDTATGR